MIRTFPDTLSDILDPADLLLHSKALEPLSAADLAELTRIEKLNKLSTYSEADVREEIVTPILRVLGYQKESLFSVNRETYLPILEKRLSADYSITPWQENFWVLEAKKPNVTKGEFAYDQLWQAVQYAIHPKINAALVVLCDGHALEIFDREASLAAPILRVERANLIRDFDQIRILLAPLQAWFFEKRRVVRLVDKVFDREFNLGRMEEFRKLLDRRLVAKRQKTIENRRIVSAEREDVDADLKAIENADLNEIIDSYYSYALPLRVAEAAGKALVGLSTASAFPVMHRLFPDRPSVANDNFMNNALYYLMFLSEEVADIAWAPGWLVGGPGVVKTDQAVEKLIELSVNHFEGDEPRKIGLLYANSIRRVIKAMIILNPQLRHDAQIQHNLERFIADEFSFAQIVASPGRQLVFKLDTVEHLALHRFITQHQPEKGSFRIESAKLELRQLWGVERALLDLVPDYNKLLKESDMEGDRNTEVSGLRYDTLGHGALCLIDKFPRWRAYTLKTHRPAIETLAAMGSWQARDWLGIDVQNPSSCNDQLFADRFFMDDLETAVALAKAYGFK